MKCALLLLIAAVFVGALAQEDALDVAVELPVLASDVAEVEVEASSQYDAVIKILNELKAKLTAELKNLASTVERFKDNKNKADASYQGALKTSTVEQKNIRGEIQMIDNLLKVLGALKAGKVGDLDIAGANGAAKRKSMGPNDFSHNGYDMHRFQVSGVMTNAAILATCQKQGMRPACDHGAYANGRCEIVGINGAGWHFSYPPHDNSNGVPLSKVAGSYFYAGNNAYPLQNTGSTHRWANGNDKNGFTFCANPTTTRDFDYQLWKLVRTRVRGHMVRENLLKACAANGLRPVCDHSAYLDGRCIVAGGAWHFSHPGHANGNHAPSAKIQGAYLYCGAGNNGWTLLNMGYTHRWSNDGDQEGDTYCTKDMRAEQSFAYNGYQMIRTKVKGAMNSANVLRACLENGSRPVCDHSHYLDGNCIVVGAAWHFSHPSHNGSFNVPLNKVKGGYFYCGYANGGRTLVNIVNTHRWSTDNDIDGDSYCTKPRRDELSFMHGNWFFQRTAVVGEMNSANILKTCTALGRGYRPVCDHAAYNNGQCVVFGSWHFSYPANGHSCSHVSNCQRLYGAFFFCGGANHGRSLANIANTHRWSNENDKNGDTYCVRQGGK